MRVESQLNIPANSGTNVADLLGRLDTGDVIRAKVLEVTSSEVVLRLFDGSVLKAAASEDLAAKVGQTLTLAVTSRTEGTLYLETVKDTSQTISKLTPDMLKSILEALQIKPDARNTALAAEFIKAGVPITANLLNQAASLMEGFKGLNVEKAVFIASKGIQAGQVKLELLARLLDGDLKLGEQLKGLQAVLNELSKSAGKNTTKDMLTNAIFNAVKTASAANVSAVSDTAAAQPLSASQGMPAGSPTISGKTVANLNISAGPVVDTTANGAGSKTGISGPQTNTAPQAIISPDNTAKTVNAAAAAGTTASTATAPATAEANAAGLTAIAASAGTMNAGNSDSVGENIEQPAMSESSQPATNKDNTSTLTHSVRHEMDDESANLLKNIPAALQEDSMNTPGKTLSEASDPFSKLKEAIKDLFVRTDSDKLATDLDVAKLHMNLNNKLDMLKAAIHTSNLAGLTGSESISAATALLDDSVKLLNQLNNSNMLYYQLPVNLSGQNTTAELFIMNRKQSKKKIDPYNTVMFISLDTNNLGRIETLLDVKGKNISINLRTEKQQVLDFVKENIKCLYAGISESGYKLVDMKYSVIDSATVPMKLEQLLSKMIDSSHSKVDLRI